MPAYAGVPVTYPGGGDTLTLVRGYEGESRTAPDIDWSSLARLDGTIVCYAGAHQLLDITEALLANGWAADEPIVIVYNGTLPSQQTIETTIGELRERLATHPPRRDAAILVIGCEQQHALRAADLPLVGRDALDDCRCTGVVRDPARHEDPRYHAGRLSPRWRFANAVGGVRQASPENRAA